MLLGQRDHVAQATQHPAAVVQDRHGDPHASRVDLGAGDGMAGQVNRPWELWRKKAMEGR